MSELTLAELQSEAEIKTKTFVCDACGDTGAVATDKTDQDGFHIEIACPVCGGKII